MNEIEKVMDDKIKMMAPAKDRIDGPEFGDGPEFPGWPERCGINPITLKGAQIVLLEGFDNASGDVVWGIIEGITKIIDPGTLVIILPEGGSIKTMDEAEMRKAGWVKASE